MSVRLFVGWLRRLSIPRCSAVALVAAALLAWSSVAFCGDIFDAANSGNLAEVKALLKDNPELVSSKTNSGRTALHCAAAMGYKDVAELLLANKADVNAKDRFGFTALHEAVNEDVAEVLLASNADVDAKTREDLSNPLQEKEEGGFTPLHLAAFSGRKGVAELLLAHNADVNSKDNMGLTPLHRAALYCHKEVAEVLLANMADVNAEDDKGETPLCIAVGGCLPDEAARRADVANTLLANNAEVDVLVKGRTPLEIARLSGVGVSLLIEYDAARRLKDQAALRKIALEGEYSSVRKAAVANLTDQAALAKIAVEDKDSFVRKTAVGLLTDRTVLAKIAAEDKDSAVHVAAVVALADQAALAKMAVEDTDSHLRVAAAEHLTDQTVLAKIALQDKDRFVRKAAVANLTDQTALATIALQDKHWFVRGAAVANLTDQTVLAKVAVADKDLSICAAAVGRLKEQTLLAQIASSDQSHQIRKLALGKITDPVLLSRVEDEAWKKVDAVGTLDDIKEFAGDFPASQHARVVDEVMGIQQVDPRISGLRVVVGGGPAEYSYAVSVDGKPTGEIIDFKTAKKRGFIQEELNPHIIRFVNLHKQLIERKNASGEWERVGDAGNN